MRSTLLAIAGGLAAALALAVLSAYLYGQRWCGRIADFGRHVQAIADGDYAAPLPSSRALELENLALSMRRMANAILEREAALAASEAHYHALFSARRWPISRSMSLTSGSSRSMMPGWLCSVTAAKRSSVARLPISLTSDPCRSCVETFPQFIERRQIDDLMCHLRQKDGQARTVLINGRVHPRTARPGAHPLHSHRHHRAPKA
jgi:HAMP domain-containing protein